MYRMWVGKTFPPSPVTLELGTTPKSCSEVDSEQIKENGALLNALYL